ncbi:hypothetical protein LEP1GSC195_2076 [Leptospira wolbachii serovar Codice str. CDC]|uniref:Uncharacterized protein n=1 Tax=Leptospira wolbachii serovar Codice str. CDC TaxID=1218599 RepID=R9A9C5_9LEPT|nr:hypothetical protein LEP1GSC195_2076 [Leptospira wolbachii serovar Codice str. CDC]
MITSLIFIYFLNVVPVKHREKFLTEEGFGDGQKKEDKLSSLAETKAEWQKEITMN